MNKVVYAFITLLSLTSCAGSFNIEGTSNVSTLDGAKLYLKILKNEDMKNIDSCEVVHGQFSFAGTVDSVRMGQIFMDNTQVMPVVLESGDIKVKIDNTQQKVSGTPLNDKLFTFINKYNQLQNQQVDLVHEHDQAIMDGRDMNAVNRQLNAKAADISRQMDKLVTATVTENFDNALGPGIFFLVTINQEVPMLDPWIEDIMSKATDKFKGDAYVKQYYAKAQENQNIMNGMKNTGTDAAQAPAAVNPSAPVTQAPTAPANVKPAPTPKEMASPGK